MRVPWPRAPIGSPGSILNKLDMLADIGKDPVALLFKSPVRARNALWLWPVCPQPSPPSQNVLCVAQHVVAGTASCVLHLQARFLREWGLFERRHTTRGPDLSVILETLSLYNFPSSTNWQRHFGDA